ncbi:hypothetical protein GW846_01790 [Candidatus Gracilibacteria bacterium]|nr:hypothetical protein [Candidatus Gracilibacteria bacterium]
MTNERDRNLDGRWREKRDDTHMGTIEEEYGLELGVRSDMELGTYLKENNYANLSEMLKDKR